MVASDLQGVRPLGALTLWKCPHHGRSRPSLRSPPEGPQFVLLMAVAGLVEKRMTITLYIIYYVQ